MKRKPMIHAARLLCVLALTMSLTTAAFAADPPEPAPATPCYPTAVTRSEDGSEIRKMYDLGPEHARLIKSPNIWKFRPVDATIHR